MDEQTKEILTSLAGIVTNLHERINEQEKVIAKFKAKEPEEQEKNEPTKEEKEYYAKHWG